MGRAACAMALGWGELDSENIEHYHRGVEPEVRVRTGSWVRNRRGHRGGEMGTRLLLRTELGQEGGIPSKEAPAMDKT